MPYEPHYGDSQSSLSPSAADQLVQEVCDSDTNYCRLSHDAAAVWNPFICIISAAATDINDPDDRTSIMRIYKSLFIYEITVARKFAFKYKYSPCDENNIPVSIHALSSLLLFHNPLRAHLQTLNSGIRQIVLLVFWLNSLLWMQQIFYVMTTLY